MDQILIAFLTVPALYLIAQRNPNLQRWGFIIGLSGQPFWLWSTLDSRQYGMFLVSVFCTWTWTCGVWNFWVVPARVSKRRLP